MLHDCKTHQVVVIPSNVFNIACIEAVLFWTHSLSDSKARKDV